MSPAAPIPPGVRIGHVHLKVADLERALRFWRDTPGFSLTQRLGRDAAFLSAGGYHHQNAGMNADVRRGYLLGECGVLPPSGRLDERQQVQDLVAAQPVHQALRHGRNPGG